MFKRTRLAILLTLSAIVIVAGCGGGGGGTSNSSQTTVSLGGNPSSTMKTFVGGETYQYQVTGTATRETANISGTITVQYIPDSASVTGAEFRRRQTTQYSVVLNGDTQTLSEVIDTWFSQDESGQILIHGIREDGGQIFTPQTPFPAYPTTFSQGQSVASKYFDSETSTFKDSIETVGAAYQVTTPWATTDTWRYTSASDDAVTTISYFSPTLGVEVYLVATFVAEGYEFEINAVLDTRN